MTDAEIEEVIERAPTSELVEHIARYAVWSSKLPGKVIELDGRPVAEHEYIRSIRYARKELDHRIPRRAP